MKVGVIRRRRRRRVGKRQRAEKDVSLALSFQRARNRTRAPERRYSKKIDEASLFLSLSPGPEVNGETTSSSRPEEREECCM